MGKTEFGCTGLALWEDRWPVVKVLVHLDIVHFMLIIFLFFLEHLSL